MKTFSFHQCFYPLIKSRKRYKAKCNKLFLFLFGNECHYNLSNTILYMLLNLACNYYYQYSCNEILTYFTICKFNFPYEKNYLKKL